MGRCRDCERCGELGIWTLLLLIPRMIIWFPRGIWWMFTTKLCPQCHHPLKWHDRRADGSFKD